MDGLRRYEGRMIDSARPLAKFLSRLLLVLILLPLADCAGGTSSADLAPAAPQQAEPPPAEPPPGAPTAKRSKSRNAKAAPAAPAEPAAPPPASTQVTGPVVMTPEKIKADCWMKYEEDKKIKNIDQRLALVEKCVDEASRNQPPQRN